MFSIRHSMAHKLITRHNLKNKELEDWSPAVVSEVKWVLLSIKWEGKSRSGNADLFFL